MDFTDEVERWWRCKRGEAARRVGQDEEERMVYCMLRQEIDRLDAVCGVCKCEARRGERGRS